MRFEEAYSAWTEKRLNQEEAARILRVCTKKLAKRLEKIGVKFSPGILP